METLNLNLGVLTGYEEVKFKSVDNYYWKAHDLIAVCEGFNSSGLIITVVKDLPNIIGSPVCLSNTVVIPESLFLKAIAENEKEKLNGSL